MASMMRYHRTRNVRSRVPLVLDLPLAFCASFVTGFVRLKDFTVKVMNRRVELDVGMNQTLSHYNECLLLYNLIASVWDKLLCHHGEAIFSMT